jgi:SAM-dependent methyltransferase
MGNEQSKATKRRLNDWRFTERYFVGHGVDIGGGSDPLSSNDVRTVKCWDKEDGDAQNMAGVLEGQYDFVVSSHCLEHMRDVYEALSNWIRIVKKGGYIVITIPDEDMYEGGHWPSKYNPDHKHTFTLFKYNSWSPVSINVFELVQEFADLVDICKLEKIDYKWKPGLDEDQTTGKAECAIEIVLRKQ